jgi:hypothetical protein
MIECKICHAKLKGHQGMHNHIMFKHKTNTNTNTNTNIKSAKEYIEQAIAENSRARVLIEKEIKRLHEMEKEYSKLKRQYHILSTTLEQMSKDTEDTKTNAV